MSVVFEFIKQNFVAVISYMDSWRLFGDFSILDFNITLLIFGAILPIVIITVSNWSSSGDISGIERSKREVLHYKNGRFYYDKEK